VRVTPLEETLLEQEAQADAQVLEHATSTRLESA
jgi:hypothetical protein